MSRQIQNTDNVWDYISKSHDIPLMQRKILAKAWESVPTIAKQKVKINMYIYRRDDMLSSEYTTDLNGATIWINIGENQTREYAEYLWFSMFKHLYEMILDYNISERYAKKAFIILLDKELSPTTYTDEFVMSKLKGGKFESLLHEWKSIKLSDEIIINDCYPIYGKLADKLKGMQQGKFSIHRLFGSVSKESISAKMDKIKKEFNNLSEDEKRGMAFDVFKKSRDLFVEKHYRKLSDVGQNDFYQNAFAETGLYLTINKFPRQNFACIGDVHSSVIDEYVNLYKGACRNLDGYEI